MFQLGLEARAELHRARQEADGGISGSVGNALHPCAKKKAHDHLGSPATPVSVSGFLCQDPLGPRQDTLPLREEVAQSGELTGEAMAEKMLGQPKAACVHC